MSIFFGHHVTRTMRTEPQLNSVPGVLDGRMVIRSLGKLGDLLYKCKSLRKVLELELPVQFAVFLLPHTLMVARRP